MVFSDTTDYNGLIQDIDFLLFGDGSTLNTNYSLKDRTRNINLVYDEAVAELFKADPNFMWDDTTNTNFPIAKLDLTANQDHYTIPDSSLVIHRVRMKDSNGEMQTLDPKLRREMSDSDLKATGSPTKYYKIDNGIFPIPVPDYGASDGVELEFQRGANHFESTDTTDEPGFNPQFHQFLSVGAALRYAKANGMAEKVRFLTEEKERTRQEMREHYERRSPDDRTRLRLKRRSTKNYGL